MKQKKTNVAKSARKFPRPPVIIITAIVIQVVAAITVLSRQAASERVTSSPAKAASNTAEKKYTTVKVAGQEVQIDGKGQIRPLTPDEAKKMADGLKTMLDKSSDGLVEEQNPDGSVQMKLNGRFQNVTIARESAAATVFTEGVETPRAGGMSVVRNHNLIRRNQPTNRPPVN